MSKIRNADELRSAAAAKGFNASPLIEEMLVALAVREQEAKSSLEAKAAARKLLVGLMVAVGVAIGAAILAGSNYSHWQSAVATSTELSTQLAAQRVADATREKQVTDTVAELRRVVQESDASKHDTSEIFSKQITQLLDENLRLKTDNEGLRATIQQRKADVATPPKS